MNFFQYMFCNQYAEISGRGGDGRKAQVNTIILSTALITMYIILVVVAYGRFNPGVPDKLFSFGSMDGKAGGRFLAACLSLIVFFALKFRIGSRAWYDRTVNLYNGMLPEQQKTAAKKGKRYFLIVSLPVVSFILWALLSVLNITGYVD